MALRPVDSPTRVAEARRKAAIKEIEENGLHSMIQNTKDAFVSVATRFNEIHAILTAVKGDTMALCEYEEKVHRGLLPFLGGDISFVVRGEAYTAQLVEDETQFTNALKKLAASPVKLETLASCVKLSELLEKSIESTESKLRKLSLVSVTDGSTTNEYEMAQKKLDQLEYAVTQLKIRANTVSELFYKIADTISNRVERYKKDFKVRFMKG